MKPVKLLLLLLLILSQSHLVVAQPHALLQDFSGYQEGSYLVLRWTFRSGSLCEGTRIERSTDGLFYTEIGRIPGFCGNPDSPITYTFTDSLPGVNTVNYYRLELGNYGFSSIVPLEHLNLGKNSFIVFSDSTGQTEIYFHNVPGRTGTAVLYSSDGKRIMETEISGNRLSLPSGRYTPGAYLLLLAFNDNTSVSGNFVLP
ncbi:MAG: hypothetical protein IPF68_15565 [Bacteroidales bacterium]|nr:hypothetical protein [Bacteroidales bacterium]